MKVKELKEKLNGCNENAEVEFHITRRPKYGPIKFKEPQKGIIFTENGAENTTVSGMLGVVGFEEDIDIRVKE